MKAMIQSNMFRTLGAAACLAFTVGNLLAQDGPPQARPGGPQGGPGNFDPEQMRQRMMERMRDQFGVKDDAEWKVLSDRLNAVMEARRNAMTGSGFGMGGPGGPGGRMGGGDRQGGPGGPGGPDAQGENRARRGPSGPDGAPAEGERGPGFRSGQGGPGGGPMGFNRQPNPELEALQKAIQEEAPAEEVKTKLEALRAARKAKEEALEKAQASLREILTARQEAIAVTMGIIK